MAIVGDWRERYARQISLKVVGEEGQRRLLATTVVVAGAGAMGSNCAEMLLRMGVGRLVVVDRDVVELSDLHRSRVLGEDHVGEPKALALANGLKAILPHTKVPGNADDITPENVTAIIQRADVVVVGLDNIESRLVLNDACLELGLPWILGRIVGTTGMVATFPSGGPCLQCVFHEVQRREFLHDCKVVGIDPTVASVVAGVQVAEVSRFILGADAPSRLITLDPWHGQWHVEDIVRNESCPACVEGRRKFLSSHMVKNVKTLCGNDAVQVSPHQRTRVDLDSKAREWAVFGTVVKSGQMLKLSLPANEIFLFESGRALIKGTTDTKEAKRLYGRYVGL